MCVVVAPKKYFGYLTCTLKCMNVTTVTYNLKPMKNNLSYSKRVNSNLNTC